MNYPEPGTPLHELQIQRHDLKTKQNRLSVQAVLTVQIRYSLGVCSGALDF